MLLCKGTSLLKSAKCLTHISPLALQAVRNSHAANYRTAGPPAPKFIIYAAEFVGGFAWWWVLWHLWTQPDHILGEFPYPDPKKWTDEELGIPSTK